MGDRLVKTSEPLGARQGIAGVYIQRRVIAKLEEINAAEGLPRSEELLEQSVRLEQAWERLYDFEDSRFGAIQDDEREHWRPLRLVLEGAALIFGVYALCLLVHQLAHLRKRAWTVPHSVLGKVTICIGAFLLFAVLHLFTILRRVPGPQDEVAAGVEILWWAILLLMLLFGLIYPALTLSSVEEVSRVSGRPEEMAELLPKARRAYRLAYAALTIRFCGVLAGLYIVVACFWMISYRIVNGLYPHQLKLLVTGLAAEEQEVMQQVIALLS